MLLVGGIPVPLKNDGVRQLKWLFPIYGKIKMFQTTNQILSIVGRMTMINMNYIMIIDHDH